MQALRLKYHWKPCFSFWVVLALDSSRKWLILAVDKTRNIEHPGTFRNILEHPGTSNNYDNYEKKMCQLKFWACSRDHLKRSEWSRRSRNMFLFASRTTTSKWIVRKNFPPWEINWKSIWGHWLLMIFWVKAGMFQPSTTQEVLARAIGSKYKVSGVTSFKRMEDLLSNGSRKSPSPCCS